VVLKIFHFFWLLTIYVPLYILQPSFFLFLNLELFFLPRTQAFYHGGHFCSTLSSMLWLIHRYEYSIANVILITKYVQFKLWLIIVNHWSINCSASQEFCWIRRKGRHAKAFWLFWSLQFSWLLVARYGFLFGVFCTIGIRNFINNVTLILFSSLSFTSALLFFSFVQLLYTSTTSV